MENAATDYPGFVMPSVKEKRTLTSSLTEQSLVQGGLLHTLSCRQTYTRKKVITLMSMQSFNRRLDTCTEILYMYKDKLTSQSYEKSLTRV